MFTVTKRTVHFERNQRNQSTSITLEDPYWHLLNTLAAERNIPVGQLVQEIGQTGLNPKNLSSSIRLWLAFPELRCLQEA